MFAAEIEAPTCGQDDRGLFFFEAAMFAAELETPNGGQATREGFCSRETLGCSLSSSETDTVYQAGQQ